MKKNHLENVRYLFKSGALLSELYFQCGDIVLFEKIKFELVGKIEKNKLIECDLLFNFYDGLIRRIIKRKSDKASDQEMIIDQFVKHVELLKNCFPKKKSSIEELIYLYACRYVPDIPFVCLNHPYVTAAMWNLATDGKGGNEKFSFGISLIQDHAAHFNESKITLSEKRQEIVRLHEKIIQHGTLNAIGRAIKILQNAHLNCFISDSKSLQECFEMIFTGMRKIKSAKASQLDVLFRRLWEAFLKSFPLMNISAIPGLVIKYFDLIEKVIHAHQLKNINNYWVHLEVTKTLLLESGALKKGPALSLIEKLEGNWVQLNSKNRSGKALEHLKLKIKALMTSSQTPIETFIGSLLEGCLNSLN